MALAAGYADGRMSGRAGRKVPNFNGRDASKKLTLDEDDKDLCERVGQGYEDLIKIPIKDWHKTPDKFRNHFLRLGG